MGGIGRATKERKRGPDDDDDSDVNTARSSRQSATKAPEEKSHLSLLRLFSRPLVPLFRRGFSFHHTRGRRHTVVRARAPPTRTTYPPRPSPPISQSGHPLSLSLASIGYYIFHRNECMYAARPTTAKPFADAHMGACGYTGFAAAAAVVSVYVSVGEKWEMGHATRALVGRERVSGSGARTRSPLVPPGSPFAWGTISFLRVRSSCAFSLSLFHSLH